jgi:hypothetical protein
VDTVTRVAIVATPVATVVIPAGTVVIRAEVKVTRGEEADSVLAAPSAVTAAEAIAVGTRREATGMAMDMGTTARPIFTAIRMPLITIATRPGITTIGAGGFRCPVVLCPPTDTETASG